LRLQKENTEPHGNNGANGNDPTYQVPVCSVISVRFGIFNLCPVQGVRIAPALGCRPACIQDVRTYIRNPRRDRCSRPGNNCRNIPCRLARDKSRPCARICPSGFPASFPAWPL